MSHRRRVWFRVNPLLFLLDHLWELVPACPSVVPHRRRTPLQTGNPSTYPVRPSSRRGHLRHEDSTRILGYTASASHPIPLGSVPVTHRPFSSCNLNDTFSARVPATDHLLYCLFLFLFRASSLVHRHLIALYHHHCIDTLNAVYVPSSTLTFHNA